MKLPCYYTAVVIFILAPCYTDLTNSCISFPHDDYDVRIPRPEILQKLDHIPDETIRNITAIQLFACPFNRLCSVEPNFTLTKNDAEAARNCCTEVQCSCEPNCVHTESCCVDYNYGFSLTEHDYTSEGEEIYECVYPMLRVLFDNKKSERRWLIAKCPEHQTIQVSTNSWFCEAEYKQLWNFGHYQYSSPVTDKKSLKSYKNMFCALCHGLKEDDVTVWKATIQGSQPILGSYNTFEEIVDTILLYPYFNVVYIPPEDIPPEMYNCIEKKCDKSGYIEYSQFVEDACLSYRSVYLNRFQNLFCALCQGVNVGHDDCKDLSYIFESKFSYIGILDFNSLDPPTRRIDSHPEMKCPEGYFWDEILNICREVTCDFLSRLVNNQCQLLYTKIKGYGFQVILVFIKHSNKLPQYSVDTVQALYNNVSTNLYPYINKFIENSSLSHFKRTFQFFIIPLLELENNKDRYHHFNQPKILGFGIDIVLDPAKEIYDLKEVLEDARKLYDIVDYESYYIIDFLHYLNMASTFSPNLTSEIWDKISKEIVQLETEIEFAVISNHETSTKSHNASSFNLTDLYDYSEDITPYIPFGLPGDIYPDEWNNFTTLQPTPFNETDKINISVDLGVENYKEAIQNITANHTKYFFSTLIFYPRVTSHVRSGYIEVNPNSMCTQVKFDINEVSIDRFEITLLKSNLTLKINQAIFCTDGLLDELCVCVETYEEVVRKYFSTHQLENKLRPYTKIYSAEFVASVSFSLLSICCNIITLLAYLVLKPLRTTPGLITMTLTFHLLIFQSIYILSNSLDIANITTLCISSGIAVHFSFLLYVFWLNISCYHMYNHFTRMGIKFFTQARFHPKKLILKYSIFVYTISTLFVALNILVSMATTNWTDLGYGSSTCYIKSPLMIGLSVGLPLGIVLLTNIILFSRTTYIAIKGLDLSMSRSGGIDDKQYLIAFLKLSILTGLTWVFGLIYQWIKVKAIGYLFITLNAGQGVLITFAFVCNSHVLFTLKSKFTTH